VIDEKSQAELRLLKKEQKKARQDEVFGGLSKAERAEFNRRAERIQDLEREIQAVAVTEEPRRQWNKTSETDTPQSGPHQPHRSREKDSAKDLPTRYEVTEESRATILTKGPE
jgi:hypothetical protein